MYKVQNRNVRFIVEVAVFAALGLEVDLLANFYSRYIWSQGGSISLVLVPIIFMAYRWGISAGLLTGLLVGSIQIIWAGSGIVHPVQVLLDYVLAYTVVGFAGVFARKIKDSNTSKIRLIYTNLGILLFGLARTILHIISGIVFFLKPASLDLSDILASLWASMAYNFGYMIPTIIITMIVLSLIIEKQTQLLYIE